MKKEKPKYNMLQNGAFLIMLAWKYRKSVLGIVLASVILVLGQRVTELLIGPAILEKVERMASLPELLTTIIMFSVLLMVISAGKAYVQENQMFGRTEVRFRLLRMIDRKVATTSYPNTLDTAFLNKQSRAMAACRDNKTAMQEVWNLLTDLLTGVLGFVVYLAMLSNLNLFLLFVIVATSAAGFVVSRNLNEWEYNHRHEREKMDGQFVYFCNKVEKRTIAKDIHIFGMRGWIEDVWKSLSRAYHAYFNRREQSYFAATVIDSVLILLRNGIAYVYLINLTLRGELSASEFLLYFNAVSGLTRWVTEIIGHLISLHAHSIEISIARELLDWPEPFRFDDGVPIPSSANAAYEITLENVSYRYPNSGKDTIRHMDLTIHPGEKLAVVGLNGAGKTTLVKLICGFLDPTEGRVLLNGRDIREFNRREYYKLFSVVFQEFSVLQTNVLENVAQMPADKADEKRVWECLEMADLAKKVRALPDGLLTHIGKSLYNDGMEFSGGQTQRLMLARALYKDAPIIALDEPTAALDPIAEHDIYMRYNEMTAGRPALFISHRLASTRFCDRILYLKDGMIAEEGTHEQLLAAGGGYAELFAVQSKYYQKEGVDCEA